jgi:hypothetical protein
MVCVSIGSTITKTQRNADGFNYLKNTLAKLQHFEQRLPFERRLPFPGS